MEDKEANDARDLQKPVWLTGPPWATIVSPLRWSWRCRRHAVCGAAPAGDHWRDISSRFVRVLNFHYCVVVPLPRAAVPCPAALPTGRAGAVGGFLPVLVGFHTP